MLFYFLKLLENKFNINIFFNYILKYLQNIYIILKFISFFFFYKY